MSMPSGRHVVAAKPGINYSLQFFTARRANLKHRVPLSCPALHLCAVVGAASCGENDGGGTRARHV